MNIVDVIGDWSETYQVFKSNIIIYLVKILLIFPLPLDQYFHIKTSGEWTEASRSWSFALKSRRCPKLAYPTSLERRIPICRPLNVWLLGMELWGKHASSFLTRPINSPVSMYQQCSIIMQSQSWSVGSLTPWVCLIQLVRRITTGCVPSPTPKQMCSSCASLLWHLPRLKISRRSGYQKSPIIAPNPNPSYWYTSGFARRCCYC